MIPPPIRAAFFALHLAPGASQWAISRAYAQRRKEPLSPTALRLLRLMRDMARSWHPAQELEQAS